MSALAPWRDSRTKAARVAQLNQSRRTRWRVLLLRRKCDPPHGSAAAYKRGCGCTACCEANSAATRRRRSRDRYDETEIA